MEVVQENIPTESNNDPKPISQEGSSSVQMEIGIKPVASDKKTTIGFKNNSVVKNIISQPKEGPEEPSSSTTSSSNKNDKQEILSRLNVDDGKSDDTNDGPPPTPEESRDTADMIIDAFDAIFVFLAQLWAKDNDDKDYRGEPAAKNKLKKYLAEILGRAKKKYPVAWLFVGLILVCYFPMAKKAHDHRKLVNEERAKNGPNATTITGEPRRRRRRTGLGEKYSSNGGSGSDAVDYVVVK